MYGGHIMYGMTFNGIRKDYVTVLRKERPPWATVQRMIEQVPGRPGGHPTSTNVQPRQIRATLLLESDNFQELQKMKEDLADWLVTEEPKELIFDDEPDRVYYAMVGEDMIFEEIIRVGVIQVLFVCPDPHKYGIEDREHNFVNASNIIVDGGVDTEPIIDVTLKEDTTYLSISNEEHINMVGSPADLDEIPAEPEELIFNYNANHLNGWVNASPDSLEEVPMTGQLLTNGKFLYVDDYGENPNYWHGPAMKTSLPESLTDFRVDVKVYMSDNMFLSQGDAGIIMVFLLDGNNQPVARIMLAKRHPGIRRVTPEFRLGTVDNKRLIMAENEWYDNGTFDGVLRLSRVGNKWSSQFIEKGWENWAHKNIKTYVDYDGVATRPITQVQVRILQSGTSPTVTQRIEYIHAYKINSLEDTQIPIIAKAGDVITFDHRNENILRNGESIIDKKAFIGEYFKLKPGSNNLVVGPSESILSSKVRYRPKWR